MSSFQAAKSVAPRAQLSARVLRRAIATNSQAVKEGVKAWWVPDPATGWYGPEGKTGNQIDLPTLREERCFTSYVDPKAIENIERPATTDPPSS